ncbi:hypothetical protein BDFB_013471 [Asbolus verrucosus]|uniref:Uncharacterized protein n=1 Tax=Asbolus verrucosus TaxID=1661398 RepID=A0A482VQP1_ASBVE|nr:hypothetical protein BDFB_013471 [Asbolus verrucosus]
MYDKATYFCHSNYMSKEFLAKACSNCLEDILQKAYHDEDPITQASLKRSQETQTRAKDFLPQTRKKSF